MQLYMLMLAATMVCIASAAVVVQSIFEIVQHRAATWTWLSRGQMVRSAKRL